MLYKNSLRSSHRKKYKILKTFLNLVRFIGLFSHNNLLNFYHIQHFNSIKYIFLKNTLYSMNLKLFCCSNALLTKNFYLFNIPSFFKKKLFLGNILVIYSTKNTFYLNKHIFTEKYVLLPLFSFFHNKFLFHIDKIKLDIAMNKYEYTRKHKEALMSLISILERNNNSIAILNNTFKTSLAFHYEALKKNKRSDSTK